MNSRIRNGYSGSDTGSVEGSGLPFRPKGGFPLPPGGGGGSGGGMGFGSCSNGGGGNGPGNGGGPGDGGNGGNSGGAGDGGYCTGQSWLITDGNPYPNTSKPALCAPIDAVPPD